MAATISVAVEIRPGEGGDDASVFADELADTITRTATRAGLAATVVAATERTRATTVTVTGPSRAVVRLEQFAGTHRVQRIPGNDRHGRRHTSTATVAVVALDGPGPVDVDPVDVVEDTHRGSGKGGQHQNTTDSAVRLRHVPTGLVVSVQGRKQHQNRAAAWAELRARLAARAERDAAAARNAARAAQVTGPDRAAKGWTWCRYRDEVVDHATGRRWRYRDATRGRIPLA